MGVHLLCLMGGALYVWQIAVPQITGHHRNGPLKGAFYVLPLRLLRGDITTKMDGKGYLEQQMLIIVRFRWKLYDTILVTKFDIGGERCFTLWLRPRIDKSVRFSFAKFGTHQSFCGSSAMEIILTIQKVPKGSLAGEIKQSGQNPNRCQYGEELLQFVSFASGTVGNL